MIEDARVGTAIWDRFPEPQRFCINLLLRCNLSCKHCNVHSNPQRTERLEFDTVVGLLKSAWEIGKRQVTYSGGEIFLDRRNLSAAIAVASEIGFSVDAETNAFWARSEQGAITILKPLIAAGLHGLILSADAFHVREMPLRKTIFAARAARTLGLLVEVNFCPSGDKAVDEDILASLSAAGIDPILNPLLEIGRASDELVLRRETLSIEDLPDCDGLMMTVHADGRVFSCCEIDGARSACPSPIQAGEIGPSNTDLRAAARHAFLLQSFYNSDSPVYFRKLVRQSAAFAELEGQRFGSICDFCRRCFSDSRRREFLETALSDELAGR